MMTASHIGLVLTVLSWLFTIYLLFRISPASGLVVPDCKSGCGDQQSQPRPPALPMN